MKLERVCLNAVQWERIKSFGPGSELGLLIERHGLFVAIRLNSLQLLKALLSGGASTNDNYKGITPLVLASAIASAALVEILLAFGVDIEAPTDSVQKGIFPGACTALIAATIKGREDVVQVLLQHGAVVDTKDTLGWTALAHACARSHLGVDVVKILLARGADPFAKTAQLCTFAAVKFDKGSNPVMIASALGHQAALAALLRRGAGMDRGRRLDARTRGGRTALLLASRHGRLPAVRALLAAGADADAAAAADAAESALTAAVFHRHRAVVAALLAAGADPHRPVDGETPVMWAARQGNAEALDLLLKAGATPAGRNPEGATALHLAAECGGAAAAAATALLLRAGADPRAREDPPLPPAPAAEPLSLRRTPLEVAVWAGRPGAVRVLLERVPGGAAAQCRDPAALLAAARANAAAAAAGDDAEITPEDAAAVLAALEGHGVPGLAAGAEERQRWRRRCVRGGLALWVALLPFPALLFWATALAAALWAGGGLFRGARRWAAAWLRGQRERGAHGA